MMDQYSNFTSLPPDQEKTFIVYEQRTAEASKKALTLGAIAAAVFGLITILIVLGVEPDKTTYIEEDEVQGLSTDDNGDDE